MNAVQSGANCVSFVVFHKQLAASLRPLPRLYECSITIFVQAANSVAVTLG